jgi:hypothetical protein
VGLPNRILSILHQARLAAHKAVRAQLAALETAATAEGPVPDLSEKEVTTRLAELVLGCDGALGGKVEDPMPKDDLVCFFAAVSPIKEEVYRVPNASER